MPQTFAQLQDWVRFLRDVAMLFGMPTVAAIAIFLYKRQIAALRSKNETLEVLQFDRALAQIKAQTELHKRERASLERQIKELGSQKSKKDGEVTELRESLAHVKSRLAFLDRDRRRIAHRLLSHSESDVTAASSSGQIEDFDAEFERLWRKALKRAGEEYFGVSVRDEQRAINERALVQATRRATERGAGAEWAAWIAKKRG